MSANRGPKPSLAPKPRPTLELHGNQERCGNGRPFASSGEAGEEPEVDATPNKMLADSRPAEEELNSYILRSSQIHRQDGFCQTKDGDAAKEVEDTVTQKMDEDRRLAGSTLTEEADSLEALWASDATFAADSEDAVEMVDTELTEEMDAEGCDGGEALADTDGVSMRDVSAGSIEGGACNPADNPQPKKRQEKLRTKEEDMGEGLSQSLTEDPGVLVSDRAPQRGGDMRTKPKFSRGAGQERKEMSFCDFSPLKLQKSLNKREAAWKSEERVGSWENYVEVFKSNSSNGMGQHQKYEARGLSPHAVEVFLDHLDYRPRVRLVSISVPVDADDSLTSSRSESTLLDSDLSDLEAHTGPSLDDATDTEQDVGEDHIYEDAGHTSEGEGVLRSGQRQYISGLEHPPVSSSPMLGSKHRNYAMPLYLSRYPRSISMEGQEASSGVYSYMEGSPKHGGAACFSGRFSRCSPSSSALSTPTSVVDIPPPFELAYITKRPVTKSSPSLFVEEDASEKNRKKKSSIKHFLMLKFRRKTDSKSAVDVSPSSFKSSSESIQHTSGRLRDPDRQAANSSPLLTSHYAKPRLSRAPPSAFYNEGDGSAVAFLNRSIVRVESFEDRSRVPFVPLPLTKPRSISFPNTDTSDYENVPPVSSDYENVQVPQRRAVRPVPFPEFFGRPARVLSSANETDGYVDMSSLPGFKGKTQQPDQETER